MLWDPEQQLGELPGVGSTRQSDLQPTGNPVESYGPWSAAGPYTRLCIGVRKNAHPCEVEGVLTVWTEVDGTARLAAADVVGDGEGRQAVRVRVLGLLDIRQEDLACGRPSTA